MCWQVLNISFSCCDSLFELYERRGEKEGGSFSHFFFASLL
jgi:hypothetical protein